MKTVANILIVTGLAALPLAASAQSASPGDVAYCKALSASYTRYVGRDQVMARGDHALASDTETQVALTKCNGPDVASAIPVIERSLTRNGITLPPRG